ncbi:hypothetical protein PPYR_13437 [Photinus pyralis]|uniref:Uncharacterized protein n=2 Tax=Photinus pyralis TaxID=7054 RepID=A0A5N4A931_PHOPY|nr:uncharacterized protein LOC116179139 [Photinus pyralis]KAB0793817.1 hypothetical protein PPYR_13437 [Photinus pyralis]
MLLVTVPPEMKTTSLCFVLLLCIVQVLSVEFPDELMDNAAHECLKEHNVDKEVLSKYLDDKFRMHDLDEMGNKLMKCTFEKRKYYSPDGGLNKEEIIKDLVKLLKFVVKKEGTDYEALAEKFYEKCDEVKDADQVEHMKKWNNCLVTEIEKIN